MAQLIAQHEDAVDDLGQAYGFEIFKDPEGYLLRLHIRTYDGIRVQDSWGSDIVRMKAQSLVGAKREAGITLEQLKAALDSVGV
jgi:hypothetical protein